MSYLISRLEKISAACNPDKLRRYYISEESDVTFYDIFTATHEAARALSTATRNPEKE